MPMFSLPGTCLGTDEVEHFVRERAAGVSRMIAGKQLLQRGVAVEYLRRIEHMILAAIHRAKALFADLAPRVGGVYRWLIAAAAEEPRPLVTLNGKSIAAGYGAVFCSLAPGTGRRRKSSGITISHNSATAAERSGFLHSG
jgi:hypothetical protein